MEFRSKGPRPTLTCDRCGRVGQVNFSLIDRFPDGSERWRCVHERPCLARKRLTDRLAAARSGLES